jgi:uncharacterized protein (TIGR00730 family)
MIISVFGGSAPKPGEPAYEEARKLGFALGSEGHSLLTGGYIGVMEAVSLGGHEAGTKVIGATCTQLEASHLIRKANPYLTEEWHFDTLKDRLFALIEKCDAAIAMPGGVGTLAEISIMWNEMIIQAIPRRPLVLFGASWKTTFQDFMQQFNSYIPAKDRDLISYAEDISTLVSTIRNYSNRSNILG